jgi:hypothetical protein
MQCFCNALLSWLHSFSNVLSTFANEFQFKLEEFSIGFNNRECESTFQTIVCEPKACERWDESVMRWIYLLQSLCSAFAMPCCLGCIRFRIR